nr:CoA transferase [Bifidobacterium pseudolongum]
MQYDKCTLTKELGAKGVPVGPVLDWNELENDPDLNEDGTLITIDQGDARGKFKTLGMPFTLSNYTPDYQRAPKLGENNEEILTALDYTEDQIKELAQKGVIGGNDGVKATLWPPRRPTDVSLTDSIYEWCLCIRGDAQAPFIYTAIRTSACHDNAAVRSGWLYVSKVSHGLSPALLCTAVGV